MRDHIHSINVIGKPFTHKLFRVHYSPMELHGAADVWQQTATVEGGINPTVLHPLSIKERERS